MEQRRCSAACVGRLKAILASNRDELSKVAPATTHNPRDLLTASDGPDNNLTIYTLSVHCLALALNRQFHLSMTR
jgi:hypothetical protein